MKALTICQPHAFFIALPDSDARCKRVENRGWEMLYRGELAIHAGKSKDWLGFNGGQEWLSPEGDNGLRLTRTELETLPFGAFVAVATVDNCIHLPTLRAAKKPHWINTHAHTCGPFCITLVNVRILPRPIHAKGAQGLWNVTPVQQVILREQLAGVRA